MGGQIHLRFRFAAGLGSMDPIPRSERFRPFFPQRKDNRRYSPPRVDTDTRVSTPISYSPCQNSGLSSAFFPRFSIPGNRRVIGGSSSICVCVHVPVE
ncbi:hypothetical protein AVEN_63976-1 [Araneus ventricosus]|uniref:Uncharacterized protein n=1 Tax=Araneus ventricosus TaxID=182803 RepID=A0A4Y2KD15_ARAVE|nr:hypothetical protein AVEN_63976-1 [Araneus ventricosus]